MIGTGEHTTFVKVKNSEKVMINGGIMITAGERIPKVEEGKKEKHVKQKVLNMFKIKPN